MKTRYGIVRLKKFEKSLERLERSGKFDVELLETAIHLLASGEPLPARYRDHALAGEYVGCRKCHLRGDLLLVYERHDDVLVLVMVDIGTHHELFGM